MVPDMQIASVCTIGVSIILCTVNCLYITCIIKTASDFDTQPNDIHQSAYFCVSKSIAKVPYFSHMLLECNSDGLEYTDDIHDITFRVPKGAVTDGQVVHFEIAIAMYGPFRFPENTQPISPIVWLCLLEKDIKLLKPFHVIIPHYLTGITEDKYQYHQVCFVKADHNDYVFENDQMIYRFYHYDAKPQFASYGGKQFGVLVSKHCCYYCIQANCTPALGKDSEFFLTRIEYCPGPQTNEIYFLATYALSLCLKVGYMFTACLFHSVTRFLLEP